MDSEFLRRLESHPAVQDLRKQDRESALAERRRLAAGRATIQAAHEKARPALLKTRDEAAAAATRARVAWCKAATEASAAEGALLAAGHTAETACARIDAQLRSTAPEAITAFVAWLDERVAEVRREPPLTTVTAVLNYGDPPQPIASNYPAIGRWIVRGVEVRRKAEALCAEALDEAELEARFAALREELGPVPGVSEAEARDPALADTLRRKLERAAKEVA